MENQNEFIFETMCELLKTFELQIEKMLSAYHAPATDILKYKEMTGFEKTHKAIELYKNANQLDDMASYIINTKKLTFVFD